MKYIKYYEHTNDNIIVGDIVKCVDTGSAIYLKKNKLYTIKDIYKLDEYHNKFYVFEEITQSHSYYDYYFVLASKEEAEKYKLEKALKKYNL